MSVQGGNAIDHAQAYAGMLADLQVSNLVSKLNGTGEDIGFGLGVITDGNDGAKLAGAAFTEAEFIGVVHRDVNYVVPTSGVGQENTARDMSVLTEGVPWARATGSISKDDPVWLGQNGVFTNVDGGTHTQITNAKFLGGTVAVTGGFIAKISFGLGG